MQDQLTKVNAALEQYIDYNYTMLAKYNCTNLKHTDWIMQYVFQILETGCSELNVL